jgi:hypothetical protein
MKLKLGLAGFLMAVSSSAFAHGGPELIKDALAAAVATAEEVDKISLKNLTSVLANLEKGEAVTVRLLRSGAEGDVKYACAEAPNGDIGCKLVK